MKKQIHILLAVFLAGFLFSLLFYPDMILEEGICIGLFASIFTKFLLDLNRQLSVKNLIVVIAVLQWLVGAVLGYRSNDLVYQEYQMTLPKTDYFGYVLPATILLILGLFLIPPGSDNRKVLLKLDFSSTYSKGVNLILLGFLCQFLPLPGFISYLLSNLRYIGLFYVYFSGHRYRLWWTVLVMGSLFIFSLGEGMFHDLLLWGTFFISIYFISNQKSFALRISIIAAGFLMASLIQISKSEIREVVWADEMKETDKILFSLNTLSDKITGDDPLFSDENKGGQVTRINQGWIIASVMQNMPENEPFARGATIKDAMIAGIFPRFMFPDKAKAGGQQNMEKYAGITLSEGTSMDISQVGEAYANFGKWGGMLFMLVLGLFFGWVIRFIEKKSLRQPELLLWIPLLFLQVVKAETSMVTILNHLVKASLVTWFFFSPWGKQLLNLRLDNLKRRKRTPGMLGGTLKGN